jgi:hypothetical protein
MAEHARDLKPGTAISFRVMAPGMSAAEAFPLWLRNAFLSFCSTTVSWPNGNAAQN